MVAISRKTAAATVHKLFELLCEYPEGASTRDIWEQLVPFIQSLPRPQNLPDVESKPTFEDVSFYFVAPIKAGWLVYSRNNWSLTDEGRKAFDTFKQPDELMSQAGKRSAQGWVASRFPRAYSTAGKTKDRMTSELRAIRRIGVSRLIKETFGKPDSWQTILPYQTPRRIPLSNQALATSMDLQSYLASVNISYREGGHAVYLSPKELSGTAFKSALSDYPADAGLKIVKNPGGVDGNGYIAGRTKGDSSIHLGMVHGHRHLTLVANLLYLKQLGPRLYDLLEFECGNHLSTAYVIQHVSGHVPTIEQCQNGVSELKRLSSEGLVQVILPNGFDDEEFECPDCSDNALIDDSGRFRYVDFQNFCLKDYGDFLESLAIQAAEKTHFGDTSILRGGRYLYQSIPGVKLQGKRSVQSRMKTLESLLNAAKVSVQNRLVLDVGCNIGMMMAEYLRLGAKWCHGWDRESTVPYTEQILFALGCTRFSVTGGDIWKARPIEQDLPQFLQQSLDGCAISYLAIRGHIDWLDSLKTIPWSFMIYEGHEGETNADFEGYITELRRLLNFELGPSSTYIDGDSGERTVAVLFRR
ncbi:MAG TPA: hypothetical protein VIX17_27815 [Pyrinomonadaceae bacterium]|jgi:hypothetical protein